MGSLKKADDQGDVKQFLQAFSPSGFVLQPKIDGIAAELIYQKGQLIKAITRGDGKQGKNITRHVRLMPLIPQTLPEAIDLVLHGELFARLDLLDNKTLKRYASARHLVAGQVNRNQPDAAILKVIDFFPWRWIDAPFVSETEVVNGLNKLGFTLPLKYTHKIHSLDDILKWREAYAVKENQIFLMDGIVVKSANFADRNKSISNSRYPGWALAWKFPAKAAVTTVVDIEFSKGKTGKITPVLVVAPVTIEGRVIRRVSLGSMNIFLAKNIRVGDQVSVMLKGLATPVFGGVVLRGSGRESADKLMPDSPLRQ